MDMDAQFHHTKPMVCNVLRLPKSVIEGCCNILNDTITWVGRVPQVWFSFIFILSYKFGDDMSMVVDLQ